MANKTTMELTGENIAGWAKKYDEKRTEKDRAVEEKMKEKLRKQRFLSKDDLVEIGMWKSPRAKKGDYPIYTERTFKVGLYRVTGKRR